VNYCSILSFTHIHSRLVGVVLEGNMPSASWVLKFLNLFGKREDNHIFIWSGSTVKKKMFAFCTV